LERIRLQSREGQRIRDMALRFRKEGIEGNTETWKRMLLAEDFKVGEQWEEEVRNYNTERGKLSLTVNRVLSIVNQLVGQHTQNPQDITAYPLNNATETRARLLSALLKHALDDCRFGKKSRDCFDDGVTTGRGFMVVDYDYTIDPERGNLVIHHLDPFDVIPEPAFEDYDYNSPLRRMKYIFFEQWVDKDAVHAIYPHVKSLRNGPQTSSLLDQAYRSVSQYIFGNIAAGRDGYRYYGSERETFSQKAKYNYRVTIGYIVEYVRGAWLVRADNPFHKIPLYTRKRIQQARQIIADYGAESRGYIVDRDRTGKPIVLPRLIKITLIDDDVVDIVRDPFDGINTLGAVRYAPYFVHGYEMGVVDNIIDPQRILNYGWSQTVNLIKMTANSGYKIKKASEAAKQWLEEHGSEDGIVIEEDMYGGKVEQLTPPPYPVAMDALVGRAGEHIARISGIRQEDPSFDKENMSGRAIALKQMSSAVASSAVFDRWNDTAEMLGKILLEHIMSGELYSDDEILAIVDREELIDPKLLNTARNIIINKMTASGIHVKNPEPPDPYLMSQLPLELQNKILHDYDQEKRAYNEYMDEVDSYAVEIAQAMLLDDMNEFVKYGRYGIKVAVSKSSQTYRLTKAVELYDLNKSLLESGHQPLPRNVLIKAADPPYKEEILQES